MVALEEDAPSRRSVCQHHSYCDGYSTRSHCVRQRLTFQTMLLINDCIVT
jgi:hypothetical protein